MLVRHFCYYLTDWDGIQARQEDYSGAQLSLPAAGDQAAQAQQEQAQADRDRFLSIFELH